jgi:hypothetical protein
MNQQLITNLDVLIEASAVFRLETEISMDEAQAKLEALGNQIIERDNEQKTFLVFDTKTNPTEVVWCCDFCNAYSKSEQIIIDHEKECR